MIQQQPNSIPEADAGSRINDILRVVEGGGRVTITRNGRPIATVVPFGLRPLNANPGTPEEIRKLIDKLIESSRGQTLGGLKLKDLINEGRP